MQKRLKTGHRSGDVTLNLSSGLHTPEGTMLFQIYYSGRGNELLAIAPSSSGFPHNGGEHTLRITGKPCDVFAWFELLAELYAKVAAVQPWFNDIKEEIQQFKELEMA